MGRKTRATSFVIVGFGIVLGAAGLGGCGNADMSDLESYVEAVKSRDAAPLDPLPRVRLVQPAPMPSKRVDPFRNIFETEEVVVVPGSRPDPHPRQELERFALDALRMVGTVEYAGAIRALIRAPDGVVHRVSAGHYLGLNAGKVTFIDGAPRDSRGSTRSVD